MEVNTTLSAVWRRIEQIKFEFPQPSSPHHTGSDTLGAIREIYPSHNGVLPVFRNWVGFPFLYENRNVCIARVAGQVAITPCNYITKTDSWLKLINECSVVNVNFLSGHTH